MGTAESTAGRPGGHGRARSAGMAKTRSEDGRSLVGSCGITRASALGRKRMANKINHRRNGQRKRREGETLKNWALSGGIQGASRGRRRWKRLRERTLRRTGKFIPGCSMFHAVELEVEEIS